LGNDVGLIDKPILRAVKAAGFAGLVLGLLGCAAQDVAAPDTVDNAQVTTETTTEKPVEFSTIGKPTKTIETPWGPREVYDPAKDKEIVSRFRNGDYTAAIRLVRRPQVRQLSELGCIKFKDDCQTFSLVNDYSCPRENYKTEEAYNTCLIATAGDVFQAKPCKKCKQPWTDMKTGENHIYDRAKPENNDFPMQNVCFAQRVRLECIYWNETKE